MKNLFAFFVLVLSCFLQVKAQVNTQDSLALVDLYNSTNGSSWTNNTNWLTTQKVETWNGITVSSGRVTELRLYSNNLIGSLPSSIGDLTMLELLHLSNNSLSGVIPSSMSGLTSLKVLVLDKNSFAGAFPVAIGTITSLEKIYLGQNGITGSIPSNIGNLLNLKELWIDRNSLTGILPSNILNLSSLIVMGVNSNLLTGAFPTGFSSMTSLISLYAHENQFTDDLPSDIGNAVNLEEIWLNNNNFSGSVPASISNLTKLKYLGLNDNQLTGTIPDFTASLSSLEWVFLENNNFNGIQSLTSSVVLTYYTVNNNQLNFEDIEPIIATAPTSGFVYNIQDSLGNGLDTVLFPGTDLTLSVNDNSASNVYQWFKDGVAISGANSSSFQIIGSQSSDIGKYTCRITNTIATDLILYSKIADVDVSSSPDPTICGIYQIDNVFVPAKGNNFYVTFRANSAVPNSIIGMDLCLTYDTSLIIPTGTTQKRNVFSGGVNSEVSRVTNFDLNRGEMNIGMYFDGDAPANKEFTGSGQILRIQFESKTDDTVSTNLQFCGIDEGYITNVVSLCAPAVQKPNKIVESHDLSNRPASYVLTGQLRHNAGGGRKRLRYDADNPNDFLPTYTTISDQNCDSISPSVLPGYNGNFTMTVSDQDKITIERDIPGDFVNNGSCNDVSSWINSADVSRIMQVATKQNNITPGIYRMIASDVNMDGKIRSNDATLAWRRNNGYICEFPQEWNYDNTGTPTGSEFSRDWVFIDVTTRNSDPDFVIDPTYPYSSGTGYSRDKIPYLDNCLSVPNVATATYTERYAGILLGDVNGNWRRDDGGTLRQANTNNENTYSLKVYNNPSESGKFQFRINDMSEEYNGIALVKVVNIMGRELISKRVNYTEVSNLDLQSYNAGNYWLVVQLDNQVLSEQIFIKK